MKIELIKLKFNGTHSYKYKLFKHCCDEIQVSFGYKERTLKQGTTTERWILI